VLIVDVYNVLHVTGVLPPHLAGLDAPGLADLIARSRKWPEAALVCDGVKPRGVPGRVEGVPGAPGVELRFAGPGRDADSLIERMIGDAPDPKRLTVVSSDRRVKAAGKRARCKVLSSEGFLRQLVERIESGRVPAGSPSAGKPEVPLDAFALRRWLDEFGVSPEELRRMAGEARAPLLRSGRGEGEGVVPAKPALTRPDSVGPPSPKGRGRKVDAGGDLSDAQMRTMLADAMKMWASSDLPADVDLTRWLDSLINPDPSDGRSARSR
jgi:hypothetical protein